MGSAPPLYIFLINYSCNLKINVINLLIGISGLGNLIPKFSSTSFIYEIEMSIKYVQNAFHFFSLNKGSNSKIINRAAVMVQNIKITSIITSDVSFDTKLYVCSSYCFFIVIDFFTNPLFIILMDTLILVSIFLKV
jgi:hypothetical protein